MSRYKVEICYDGTDFHGWQVQPNAVTVQETVQDAAEKLFNKRLDITGCSRTDTGVHANSFFIHFDFDEFSEKNIVSGLNSFLPNTVRVLNAERVDDCFHARYSAKGKKYIYFLDTSPVQNPVFSKYSLHFPQKLNCEKMKIFADKIIGTHDFIGFSSSKRTVTDTVRTITEFNIEEKDNFIVFSLTGDGFLYNMVRILVGTAIDVGLGKIKTEDIDYIINSHDRNLAGMTVLPHGLFLDKVFY